MAGDKQQTAFRVDSARCSCCGACVAACPMRILAIRNGCCVMTAVEKCLECGTCMYACSENALAVADLPVKAVRSTQGDRSADVAAERSGATVLDVLTGIIMQELRPQQLYTFDGSDIRELDRYALEGQACFARAYTADKLEKLCIARTNFFGDMTADVVTINPGLEYDIPAYTMDWAESSDYIFFFCDLLAADDPGRNARYREAYLYEPLEDLYQTYAGIPGMKPSVFHWVRCLHTPYAVTGNIDKSDRRNVAMLLNCAAEYLRAWIGLWKNARPGDPDSAYMQLVRERRREIRRLYHENDPGSGALDKFLGTEKSRTIMKMMMP